MLNVPLITQSIRIKRALINLSVSIFCSKVIRAAKSNYFESYALLAATDRSDALLFAPLCEFRPANVDLVSLRCSSPLRFAHRSTMFSASGLSWRRIENKKVCNDINIIIIRMFCPKAGLSLQTQEPRLQFCPKAGLPPQTQEPGLQFTRDE